jgi:hypothetical protein
MRRRTPAALFQQIAINRAVDAIMQGRTASSLQWRRPGQGRSRLPNLLQTLVTRWNRSNDPSAPQDSVPHGPNLVDDPKDKIFVPFGDATQD